VVWSRPTRVTASPDGDFYPTLFQDTQGVFHLVWFRWRTLFRGPIWSNSSADGLAWNPRTEVQVTTEAEVDDWVPTITQAADGTLLVYFVSSRRSPGRSTSDIYVAAKRLGSARWTPAAPVSAINSPTEHDHLPFAA
jgi:hypothetical protein